MAAKLESDELDSAFMQWAYGIDILDPRTSTRTTARNEGRLASRHGKGV